MTETKKRGPGRPPKPKAVATPPTQPEQAAMQRILKRFMVACNQRDQPKAEQKRDELVHMLDRLGGVR